MLPPHLPANRKIANGTRARAGRPVERKAAAKAAARRIVLKGPLMVQTERTFSMIAKMREGKARQC